MLEQVAQRMLWVSKTEDFWGQPENALDSHELGKSDQAMKWMHCSSFPAGLHNTVPFTFDLLNAGLGIMVSWDNSSSVHEKCYVSLFACYLNSASFLE